MGCGTLGAGVGQGKGEGELPGSEWEPALGGVADTAGRGRNDRICYPRTKGTGVSQVTTGSGIDLGTVAEACM